MTKTNKKSVNKKDTSRKTSTPRNRTTIRKSNKSQVDYTFNTDNGFLSVGADDIIDALKELSDHNNEPRNNTDNTDIQGWSVIHGKDTDGKMRPLFLMRSLPLCNYMVPGQFAQDDKKMAEIVIKKVYHLNPFKIKWIQFKNRIVQYLMIGFLKIRGIK